MSESPNWNTSWAPLPLPPFYASGESVVTENMKHAKSMLKRMHRSKASCDYFGIRKTFPQGDYTGYVHAWHGPECGYHVLYTDGDCEHLLERDVLKFHEKFIRWRQREFSSLI